MLLPEAAWVFAKHQGQNRELADAHQSIARQASDWAKQYQITLVAGTLPVHSPDGRLYSRVIVFNEDGECAGHYDKMHLFDVDIADGSGRYAESDSYCPGEAPAQIDWHGVKVGLTVCYDLRFPELFQWYKAQGAQLILVPAAFTAKTGKAHWQTLLQARAIENQCFIAAAGQWGEHDNGRATWGQSIVIDPWGEPIEQLAQGTGWVSSEIRVSQIFEIERMMPVQSHKRFCLARPKN